MTIDTSIVTAFALWFNHRSCQLYFLILQESNSLLCAFYDGNISLPWKGICKNKETCFTRLPTTVPTCMTLTCSVSWPPADPASSSIRSTRPVCFLIEYHCLNDTLAEEYLQSADIIRAKKRTWLLYQILKDADALDRVRFGIYDLDVYQLRLPISHKLVPLAVTAVIGIKIWWLNSRME